MNKKDFYFAKMFVKIVAKLIFERAVMLGILKGSPVFMKSTKYIKVLYDLKMVIVS